jgi:MoaA/NifB/PqqE/SkfB family radical SAM enzyme
MKTFTRVYIEIGNVCNLQCGFCPEVIRTKKMMTPDFFAQVLEQVAPLTDEVTLHLMGDPLVHPHLPEMVELCARFGLRIFLVTNGVLLLENRVQTLLHPAFRQVNFSLHSFHDNFPERDPSEYLERIFQFTERALRERPDLYLNYRLWNLNDPRGSRTDNQDILKRVEARFDLPPTGPVDVRRNKSVPIRGRLYFHFDTEFTWPSLDLPVLGEVGRCHGLSAHFGILADGSVVPCCLDKEGVITLGRLPEQPLTEILNGPRAKQLVKGFQNRKLVEELCRRCNYIERFAPNAPVA